jgi:hypothetical protein
MEPIDWIQEPTHETWSQDNKDYLHKYGNADINYELAIGLFKNQLM